MLGIIYFGLFTPIGLFRKIIGKDELKLKFKNINSYWLQRENVNITPKLLKINFEYYEFYFRVISVFK